jgi:hypothetical protein
MQIDADTAVVVCAGPSLDRLSPVAWAEVAKAGAIVGVNGAPASRACADVPFTAIAAMDLATGLATHVPRLADVWRETPAWRVASTDSRTVDAESYVVEVDEADGVEGWSDHGREGYKGGSTGMVIGNWLGNAWPDDDATRAALHRISTRASKRVHPRGFRKLAYLGLDMHAGDGLHADGAGAHASGFAQSPQRYGNVCRGWEKFCNEAAKRGVTVVNLTPGTGLATMPRADVPPSWVR